MNRIPRIIHQIWLHDTPISFECETWKLRNHDWKHKVWTIESLKKAGLGILAQQCRIQKKHNELLMNLLRLNILKLCGGIFVDNKLACKYPINKNWEEYEFIYSNKIIGATQNSPVINNYLNNFRKIKNLKLDGIAMGMGIKTLFIPDEMFTEQGMDERKILNRKNPRLNKNIITYLKTNDPLISVIVTIHNQKKFIDEGIGGFCDQDIKIPYEVLAICDNDTDGSAEYIRTKYPHVKVHEVDFRHPCSARNYGIDHAIGKYICFFDGDDIPHYDYLSKLYTALQEHPDKNLAYGRFNYDGFGLEQKKIPVCNHFEWSPTWFEYGPVTNTPVMIKREVLDNARWDSNIRTREDYEFGMSLIEAGANGVHVRDILWDYRIHGESIWGSRDAYALAQHSMNYIQKKHNINPVKLETTFVSLIARKETLDMYFENIKDIDMPRNKMHYFVFIDSNDGNFIEEVKQRAFELNFRTTRVFATNEETLLDSKSFINRGMRIARNMETIINDIDRVHGGSEFIFMVEDDTRVPKNAYKKLLKHMKDNENLAFITGVEASRLQDRHLGIAHLTGDVKGEIIHRINPLPKKKGLEKVTSAGWYCWVGRIKQLKQLKKYRCTDETNDDRFIGPDAYFVYDLSQLGFDTMVDWSIWCEHWDEKNKYYIKPDEATYLEFSHYYENGRWKRTQLHGA